MKVFINAAIAFCVAVAAGGMGFVAYQVIRQPILEDRIDQLGLMLNQTNLRIDKTNEKIDQSNERIDKTNEIIDEKVGQTNLRIDQTNLRIDQVQMTLIETNEKINEMTTVVSEFSQLVLFALRGNNTGANGESGPVYLTGKDWLVLNKITPILEEIPSLEWNATGIEAATKNFAASNSLELDMVERILAKAVIKLPANSEIYGILADFGKEKTLARIVRCEICAMN